jgi:hypothetical protein
MPEDIIQGEALAIREEVAAPPAALFAGEPDEIVTRAVKVADALKKVVESKGLIKKIQGRDFVEVAGWQTLGTMVGVTAFCEWSRELPDGWEARVTVRRNGQDIGAAEAQCTRAEKTWKARDPYALRSMAQTRATSKALRSVLGFIVVLAGYADTPAEEMPDYQGPAASRPLETSPKVVSGVKAVTKSAQAHSTVVRDPGPGAEGDHDPVKKGEALDACMTLKRERFISTGLWQELLKEMFPHHVSPISKIVSDGDLSVGELRAVWAEANRRTKGTAGGGGSHPTPAGRQSVAVSQDPPLFDGLDEEIPL